jgi:protein-S-isoprenylcysteine O-methyltransferase Ste14
MRHREQPALSRRELTPAAGVRAMQWVRSMWDRTPLPPPTLVGVVVGALAQRTRPVRLPGWTRPVGWVLFCGGVGLMGAAARERGAGSLGDPHDLTTRGTHAWSRNPMYLGAVVAQAGLAGVGRNAWILAATPLSAVLLHRSVLHEERWLHARFGPQYDSYRTAVPRWF